MRMQRISRAPVLSATRRRDSTWITWHALQDLRQAPALELGQRAGLDDAHDVADVGLVALVVRVQLDERRTILWYLGCGLAESMRTVIVLSGCRRDDDAAALLAAALHSDRLRLADVGAALLLGLGLPCLERLRARTARAWAPREQARRPWLRPSSAWRPAWPRPRGLGGRLCLGGCLCLGLGRCLCLGLGDCLGGRLVGLGLGGGLRPGSRASASRPREQPPASTASSAVSSTGVSSMFVSSAMWSTPSSRVPARAE